MRRRNGLYEEGFIIGIMTMPRICPQCHHTIPEGAFCPFCGFHLADDASPVPPPPGTSTIPKPVSHRRPILIVAAILTTAVILLSCILVPRLLSGRSGVNDPSPLLPQASPQVTLPPESTNICPGGPKDEQQTAFVWQRAAGMMVSPVMECSTAGTGSVASGQHIAAMVWMLDMPRPAACTLTIPDESRIVFDKGRVLATWGGKQKPQAFMAVAAKEDEGGDVTDAALYPLDVHDASCTVGKRIPAPLLAGDFDQYDWGASENTILVNVTNRENQSNGLQAVRISRDGSQREIRPRGGIDPEVGSSLSANSAKGVYGTFTENSLELRSIDDDSLLMKARDQDATSYRVWRFGNDRWLLQTSDEFLFVLDSSGRIVDAWADEDKVDARPTVQVHQLHDGSIIIRTDKSLYDWKPGGKPSRIGDVSDYVGYDTSVNAMTGMLYAWKNDGPCVTISRKGVIGECGTLVPYPGSPSLDSHGYDWDATAFDQQVWAPPLYSSMTLIMTTNTADEMVTDGREPTSPTQ